MRMGHQKREKSYDKSVLPFSISDSRDIIKEQIECELKPAFDRLKTLFDLFENELDVM